MSTVLPRVVSQNVPRCRGILVCNMCLDIRRTNPVSTQSRHLSQASKYSSQPGSFPRLTHAISSRQYSDKVSSIDRDPGKFHQTMIQRLTSLEDSMRYHGYSTIRIGFCIVIAIGLGVYIFREYIRENVADEVSNVATMSLGDSGVKMKVQELAVALIQTILNNPGIQSQTVQFLEDVFQNPATKQALISLLLHVLNDPVAQSQLTSTLKRAVDTSLSDKKFRAQLASNLRHLLRDESTKQGLLDLISYVFQEESMKEETQKFFKEVLSSEMVRDEASRLGKNTVKDVIGDSDVQKKTGDALWTAFTYSVTPRVFGGGKGPSGDNDVKNMNTNSDSHKDGKSKELPEGQSSHS